MSLETRSQIKTFLLSAVVGFLLETGARSCSCLFDPFAYSIPGIYEHSSMLMKVRIILPLSAGAGRQESFPDNPSGVAPIEGFEAINSDVYYVARVGRVLKGCPPTQQYVVIKTAGNGGLCGFGFVKDQTYLLDGIKVPLGDSVSFGDFGTLDVYSAYLCSGTRTWNLLAPTEKQWLRGQDYSCRNQSLCANGHHSELAKECATICPPCAERQGLVCKPAQCLGCGRVSLYNSTEPFNIVTGCRKA
uniref:Uncharacterized protein n=1 Tax=Compsopogon caeruleus TaxID=31354 RepID=A0A7S1TDX9_9RHOD|mmetsp:Transcript_1842/g.3347  ORF Transcript_1842/g.3347 Transcript_1842/m.3347 type:complete len:246 (+) Transcript_1842:129-866(+)